MASASREVGRARYIAIITDGNGRWAKRRGLPVVAGHEAGADTVKARLRDAVDLGVQELTVYSFSTENWSRSEEEVSALMEMFARRIELETPELHEQGVRMRFIGRRADPAARAVPAPPEAPLARPPRSRGHRNRVAAVRRAPAAGPGAQRRAGGVRTCCRGSSLPSRPRSSPSCSSTSAGPSSRCS